MSAKNLIFHENMEGRIIRSHRMPFSPNVCLLDNFSEWQIERIHAEMLAGTIKFYAYCKSLEENPLLPFMEIQLTEHGVVDSYRLMPKHYK